MSPSKPVEDDKAFEALAHGLAGALGGVLALTSTCPLMVITTRLQVQEREGKETYKGPVDAFYRILKEEGVAGLYAGLSSGLIGTVASQGVYYYWYALISSWLQARKQGQKLSVVDNLLGSSIAGILNVLVTLPIWTVNTRMQTQRKQKKEGSAPSRDTGIVATFTQIIMESGITGLWNGLGPSIILVANPVIQYVVFERMKIFIETSRNAKLTVSDIFLTATISKLIALAALYPYLIAKSRLQVAKDGTKTTLEAWKKIIREDGLLGLYKGMSSKAIQGVLTAIILFLAKEKLVYYTFQFVRMFKSKKPVSA